MFFITVALSETSLKKLFKEEVINLALDYQSKFHSTLAGLRNELSELKKDFEKLGSELAVSKRVIGMLEKRVINMERQYWSNSQYSGWEYLEETRIPDSTESKDLEQTVLKVLEKLEIMLDLVSVEDCHWIKTSKVPKRL